MSPECAAGRYGTQCERGCARCARGLCDRMSGDCDEGCAPGWQALAARQVGRTAVAVVVAAVGGRGWGGGGRGGGGGGGGRGGGSGCLHVRYCTVEKHLNTV